MVGQHKAPIVSPSAPIPPYAHPAAAKAGGGIGEATHPGRTAGAGRGDNQLSVIALFLIV